MAHLLLQFFFIMIGVLAIQFARSIFVTLASYPYEQMIGEILFYPYIYLFAFISFVCGFLALSYVFTQRFRFQQRLIYEKKSRYLNRLLVASLGGAFLYLATIGVVGLIAVILSLFYGIMDAGLFSNSRKKRYERS